MVIQTLRNLSARAYHANRRDYIDMGLGIEARAKRCQEYWKPHLELTKSFQREALKKCVNCKSIAIFGAGSLLDIAIGDVLSHFEKIDLYDANPLAKRSWAKLKKTPGQVVAGHILDLTNSIDRWSEALKTYMKTSSPASQLEIAEFIRNLKTNSQDFRSFRGFDVVFSINLLSQLPIYWRDRVYKTLLEACEIDTNVAGEYEEDLQKALVENMRTLQLHHLELLKSTDAKLIVLISDTEFFYYHRENSYWQSERATYFEGEPVPAGYRKQHSDTWLWHIIPQGVEESEYGSYHKVCAYLLIKEK